MRGVVLGCNRVSYSTADNSEPKYRDQRMYNREGVVPGFRTALLVSQRNHKVEVRNKMEGQGPTC